MSPLAPTPMDDTRADMFAGVSRIGGQAPLAASDDIVARSPPNQEAVSPATKEGRRRTIFGRAGTDDPTGFHGMRRRMLRKKKKVREPVSEREKSRRSLAWCLSMITPHAPNFGLMPRNELVISVDPEQGIYISGHVPVENVFPDKTFMGNLGRPKGVTPHLQLPSSGTTSSRAATHTVAASRMPGMDAGLGGTLLVNTAKRPNVRNASPRTTLMTSSASPPRNAGKAVAESGQSVLSKGSGATELNMPAGARRPLPFYRQPTLELGTNKEEVGPEIRIRLVRGVIGVSGGEKTGTAPPVRTTSEYEAGGGDHMAEWPGAAETRLATTAPELYPEGWMPMDDAGSPEVLVYVHGFNNTHVETLQIMGQMAVFGNYPNHLKLINFVWPSGTGLLGYFDGKKTAMDAKSHAAVQNFFVSLSENGVRNVHVITHSMGTRLFLRSLRKMSHNGMFRFMEAKNGKKRPEFSNSAKMSGVDILTPPQETASPTNFASSGASGATAAPGATPSKGEEAPNLSSESPEYMGDPLPPGTEAMQLVSVTFFNPDYYLEDFVEHDYDVLRRHTNHISIFADEKDMALWWSEKISGQMSLGRHVFGLCRIGGMCAKQNEVKRHAEDGPASSDSVALAPPKFLNTLSFFSIDKRPRRQDDMDGETHSSMWQQRQRGITEWRKEVKQRNRIIDEGDLEWLDVDVIDTTFMDQNVNSLRHSFFNLNREIIEDIRELIVSRKRARQRYGRLDRRDGNAWVYRVAPSFLTSIFESSL